MKNILCHIIGHKSSGKWRYETKTGNIISVCRRCDEHYVYKQKWHWLSK